MVKKMIFMSLFFYINIKPIVPEDFGNSYFKVSISVFCPLGGNGHPQTPVIINFSNF